MTTDYRAACNYDVWCEWCAEQYSEQDPAVTFHHDDHIWTCTDEAACIERHAERSTTL